MNRTINPWFDFGLPLYTGGCMVLAGVMAYFGFAVATGIWAGQAGAYSVVLAIRYYQIRDAFSGTPSSRFDRDNAEDENLESKGRPEK